MHELYSLQDDLFHLMYNCLIVVIHYIISSRCHGIISYGYNWWSMSGEVATNNNYYSNFAVTIPVL